MSNTNPRTIDRWSLVNGATPSRLVITSDEVQFAAQVKYLNFLQKIECPEKYSGKTCTISVLTAVEDDNLIVGCVFSNGGYSQCGTKKNTNLITHTFTVPNGTGINYIFIQNLGDTGRLKTHYLVAAKLELSDRQTLAHQDEYGDWVLNDPPPNFQQELAKCQRYYRTGYFNTTIGSMYGGTKSKFTLVVENMRTMPAVSITDIENQGWGNVNIGNYSSGWKDTFGTDRFINYMR